MRRLQKRAQFQAVLAAGTVARTPHFALHRLGLPAAAAASAGAPLFAPMDAGWLGALVPKRWARRAVTRNAVRRQIHALAAARPLPPGAAYVVRLRSAFDRVQFPSATSTALKAALRAELAVLWARALREPAAEGRARAGGPSHTAPAPLVPTPLP